MALHCDFDTLRQCAWLPGTALVLCDIRDLKAHELVSVAPRSILRRQIDACAELGFGTAVATELEYFMFTESYKEAAQKKYGRTQSRATKLPHTCTPKHAHSYTHKHTHT